MRQENNIVISEEHSQKRLFQFLYWMLVIVPVVMIGLTIVGEVVSRRNFQLLEKEVTKKGGEVSLVSEHEGKRKFWYDLLLPLRGRDKRMEEILRLSDFSSETDDIWMKQVVLMRNLEAIHLNGSAISDIGVSYLSNLENLHTVSLTSNSISDDSFQHLKDLEKLKSLTLDNTNITGKGLLYMNHRSKIRYLSMSKCKNLTPEIFAHLKSFTSLDTLILSESNISDTHLESLKKLPEGIRLYLDSVDISDKGLKSLSILSNVNWIVLTDTPITDESIPYLVKMNPKLLHIMGTKLTSRGVKKLKNLLPNSEIIWDFSK